MALTIIAQIEAKKEHLAFVKEELLKLIEPTKKEVGYLEYRLQQDNEHPEKFIFVEQWENQDLWQTHMESKHLKEFVKNSDGCLVGLTIHQLHEIS